MRTRPGRTAVTLVEVLVTIFIMGLGMLALLTLFPVGAVSMARALKDDRAANAAVNADGIAWAQNLRNDPVVTPYFLTFQGITVPTGPGAGPSFGVYVDPFGYLVDPNAKAPPANNPAGWVGAYSTGGTTISVGIPRTSMTLQNYTQRNSGGSPYTTLTSPECSRWCTLLDDLLFQNDGTPDISSGGPVRYGAYTWAWLLRQNVAGDPSSGINCWVVVYRNRDTSSLTGETTYGATGTMFSDSVTVNATGLSLRTGTWVLDTTPTSSNPTGQNGVPGYFYRVIDWYEDAGSGTTVLQLDSSLQSNCNVLTVMDSVVEVFNRGTAGITQ